MWFESEYTKEGSPYRAILCRVRKRDVPEFLAVLEELKKKMLLCGHLDYVSEVSTFMDAAEKRKERQIKMKLTPLKKQSKNAQRKYYAAKRGSWNGLSPVTRIVQSRKAYDRNHIRQEERRSPKD